MGAGVSSLELGRHWVDSLVATGAGVDFDASLIIMLAIFLGLMIYLNQTLFKPYLKVKDDRSAQIDGAKEKAVQMQDKADRIFSQYERKLTRAREQAVAERAEVKDSAKEAEQQILSEARGDVDQMLEAARQEIADQVEHASADLDRQAKTLSKLIVDKVLAG